MPQNAAKKPSPPPQNSITESEAPPTVCVNLSLQDHGDVQTLSMNCTNRDIGHLVENCNCGAPQFSARLDLMPCRHNNGHVTTCPRTAPVNLHGLQQCLEHKNKHVRNLVRELQLWKSTVLCTVKPKHLSLYNNGCPNQSKNCTWRISGLLHSLHCASFSVKQLKYPPPCRRTESEATKDCGDLSCMITGTRNLLLLF